MRIRATFMAATVALLLLAAGATSAFAAETEVRVGGHMNGWIGQTNASENDAPHEFGEPLAPNEPFCDGSVSLVPGPGTPPLGRGSAELETGNGTTGGECAAQVRNDRYAGEKLSELTTLAYSTYLQEHSVNEDQDTFLTLFVNNEGRPHGAVDDELFFEPPYQSHATGNPSLPEQGSVEQGKWQTWNAAAGGWWDNNEELGTPGSGVEPLSKYLEAHPEAVIVNSSRGGGVRVAVGEAEEDAKFVSYVDDFTIGFGATTTAYNFEPTPPTAIISSPTTGSTYDKGDSVATEFSCQPSPAEAGFEFGEAGIEAGSPIASCKDSRGVEGNPGDGSLETGSLGSHSYAVTAKSQNGEEATAEIDYQVVAAPSVVTGVSSAVTETEATLSGTVDPNDANVTDCRFEYGLSMSYGSSVPCSPSPGSGTSPVAVTATRDRPDTGCHVLLPRIGDQLRRHRPRIRRNVQNTRHATAADDHTDIAQTRVRGGWDVGDDHRHQPRRSQGSQIRDDQGDGALERLRHLADRHLTGGRDALDGPRRRDNGRRHQRHDGQRGGEDEVQVHEGEGVALSLARRSG